MSTDLPLQRRTAGNEKAPFSRGFSDFFGLVRRWEWWAWLGLNQRPLRCERNALPLSYTPSKETKFIHAPPAKRNRHGRGSRPPPHRQEVKNAATGPCRGVARGETPLAFAAVDRRRRGIGSPRPTPVVPGTVSGWTGRQRPPAFGAVVGAASRRRASRPGSSPPSRPLSRSSCGSSGRSRRRRYGCGGRRRDRRRDRPDAPC